MSSNVSTKLCYGASFNSSDIPEDQLREVGGYENEYFEQFSFGEFASLKIVEARGMYDEETSYVVTVRSKVIVSNEDRAIMDVELEELSSDEKALVLRFMAEKLDIHSAELGWKLTIYVSN